MVFDGSPHEVGVMTAAAQYAARLDAIAAQRARRQAQGRATRSRDSVAERFRANPRRALDANLEALAAYMEADDVVVDVGGGAGRVGLPLALRCRELINVEPWPAMRTEFERSAQEAGITNTRVVSAAWPEAPGIAGDVVLTTQVTYFVREIVPFIRRMEAATRRRVIISLWSVPPPVWGAALYRLVHAEPMATPPGHRELLPVLWELGILPDVVVLPLPQRYIASFPPQPTREEMVDLAVASLPAAEPDAARALVEDHFDDLFVRDAEGYALAWPADVREMLITWEPHR